MSRDVRRSRMETRGRTRRALTAGLCICVSLGALTGAQPVLANWDTVERATAQASTVVVPDLIVQSAGDPKCSFNISGGRANISVTWDPPPSLVGHVWKNAMDYGEVRNNSVKTLPSGYSGSTNDAAGGAFTSLIAGTWGTPLNHVLTVAVRARTDYGWPTPWITLRAERTSVRPNTYCSVGTLRDW